MSNNPPPAIAPSKSVNTPAQLSPAHSQSSSSAFGDLYGQRRTGSSGSFGAGASSRQVATPRNSQASRKQHKGFKKSRLADEDAIAESVAMRSTSSRKGQTSITHLMNFSLPPRPQYNHQSYSYGHRNSRRNPTWGLGSGYHAVDKARYVNANYRFIVDPRADYRAQREDPDVHLDWSNVLQVLASSQSQATSCPICLGNPVAPRMAKCGHVFCLPCLIRYMHSDDSANPPPEKKARWKKCPICYDSIYISETRPTRFVTGQEGEAPREGDDVRLRLIMRPSVRTLALPRDGADTLAKEDDIPWHFAAEVMDYARIMKGTETYLVACYDEDIAELQRQEHEDELMFGEDTQWTRRAVKVLEDYKEKLKDIGNPPSMPAKPAEPKPKKAPIQFDDGHADVPDMYYIQHAARSGQSISEPSAASKTDAIFARSSAIASSLAELRNRQHHEYQPSEYFFYQALMHYYLSPLDIRILKAAFGYFSSFPSTILPRVEHVSTGHIIDDDLRKRTKYLAHLPYGCEVGFLECDWTDVVAPEILEKFRPEIERRRKRNFDKETREEKERIRAEKEEEDKRYAAARRKRPSIPVDQSSITEFQPLESSASTDVATSSGAEMTSSTPPWHTGRAQGSAFASLASPSTSPEQPRTVWGTAAITPVSPELVAQPRQPDTVDDGWLQGWERDLLHEEDLVAQVQAASLSTGKGGGKKKKNKITLMSTTARRGA
ncbi:hypothetical protein EV356DRAFT_492152 [Viridothelium virens]|uniref:RING-type domain-containing protein n=1 Tax=Viridothelium virens TaxID=1048519 RepID=A0A6A6GXJ5_VIRVR|nr:hypothetical protein EV356DRAFT_492152 [Viridothelium virens]